MLINFDGETVEVVRNATVMHCSNNFESLV